jgi:hypothetical protein
MYRGTNGSQFAYPLHPLVLSGSGFALLMFDEFSNAKYGTHQTGRGSSPDGPYRHPRYTCLRKVYTQIKHLVITLTLVAAEGRIAAEAGAATK